MALHNFIIAGNRAILIANDLSDRRYAAGQTFVPAGVQAPAKVNETAETVFVVERGTLEFMVGGAQNFVGEGGYVRVPKGVPFAYRNADDTTARLLVRAQLPADPSPVCRITLEFAA
jgi:mannose-6-phosphate isomerase-like protein (cupin superfamily)